MTFIDYFVSAYYYNKPLSKVKLIIEIRGKKYIKAKEEYLIMKNNNTRSYMVDWIKKRIKYQRFQFISTYRN